MTAQEVIRCLATLNPDMMVYVRDSNGKLMSVQDIVITTMERDGYEVTELDTWDDGISDEYKE